MAKKMKVGQTYVTDYGNGDVGITEPGYQASKGKLNEIEAQKMADQGMTKFEIMQKQHPIRAAIATGLMGFAQGGDGSGPLSNFQDQQTAEKNRIALMRIQQMKMEAEANDPEKQVRDFEARQKFEIYQKLKSNQPVQPWEKSFVGIKDETTKPDDWSLWKQAENEAKTSMGASPFGGLDGKNQKDFYPNIQKRYLELKKQFGVETPDDKFARAKNYLKSQGIVSTNETATMFLKRNPKF